MHYGELGCIFVALNFYPAFISANLMNCPVKAPLKPEMCHELMR